MDKIWVVPVSVTLLLLIFGLMWWSWCRRSCRDAKLGGYPVPVDLSVPLLRLPIIYVATTQFADRLERVLVRGLEFRASGEVLWYSHGLLFELSSGPIWLPATVITNCDLASFTIDRGVERGGLVAIEWRPLSVLSSSSVNASGEAVNVAANTEIVVSYLRAKVSTDTSRLLRAVQELNPEKVESE